MKKIKFFCTLWLIETWENMIASEWGELSRAGHSLVDPDGNIKFRIVNTTESTETTIKE